MEKRIEEAYAQRPRRWLFEAAVALVVVALLEEMAMGLV